MASAIDQLDGGQWVYTFFTIRNYFTPMVITNFLYFDKIFIRTQITMIFDPENNIINSSC